jgi:hypothetical protein
MLEVIYEGLGQDIFTIYHAPEPVIAIENIAEYNKKEGLALSDEEINYLDGVAKQLGRPLTDSEVFGFSQVNSEHCRHKIFNGTFIIDGKEMKSSLFKMIKKTSEKNPNYIISAYKGWPRSSSDRFVPDVTAIAQWRAIRSARLRPLGARPVRSARRSTRPTAAWV